MTNKQENLSKPLMVGPLPDRRRFLGAAAGFMSFATVPALAQDSTGSTGRLGAFKAGEVVQQGHQFFGTVSRSLATLIEQANARWGRPNGYILGEEAGGAILGGAQYGEGLLYTRDSGQHKVFWQGPSFGLDFGADGSRSMMLIYRLASVGGIYQRFGGVQGSAYVVGGFGMTALAAGETILVPIKSGVGARLGINVGYLKFTQQPTWNPF
jgi:hypothetical protein